MSIDGPDIQTFVDAHYGRVVAAVALVCGDRGVAEDAVQDALVRAWQSKDCIDSMPAWVTAVALNQARSSLRRVGAERRAQVRLALRAPSPDAELPPLPDEPLALALAGLPRRQREAVVLHYYLDLPVIETALLLGVSEGTVKTCLHRAREALRGSLGPSRARPGRLTLAPR